MVEVRKEKQKRDKGYWIQLNAWRWEFLRLSTPYKDIYQKSLTSSNFEFLSTQCFSLFNLYLTKEFHKQKKLPDPEKPIKEQIGKIYFYDYYYHITGESLLMEKTYGSKERPDPRTKKPCLHISNFSKDKILSFMQHQFIGAFFSEKHRFFSFPKRIIPGLELFVIDSNLPINEAVECFKQEYAQLKDKQEKRSNSLFKSTKECLGVYSLPDKKKNQRFEEWDICLKAYNIYKSVEKEFEESEVLDEFKKSEVLEEAQEAFQKKYSEKLKKIYLSKKYKISFEKWCNRTYYEWKKRSEELIDLASSGLFVLPD